MEVLYKLLGIFTVTLRNYIVGSFTGSTNGARSDVNQPCLWAKASGYLLFLKTCTIDSM